MMGERTIAAQRDVRTEEADTPLDVVCVGETMAMVTPEQPEPLESAHNIVIRTGGAESNVAMYLARFGHRVEWVSRLGNDALGRRILRDIVAAGVETSFVEIDEEAPTGVYFKDPGKGSTRLLYYRRGSAASLMGSALLNPVIRLSPQLLHLSGITPALSKQCNDMMSELVSQFRSVGATISFDVNYRPSLWPSATAATRLHELAQQADIVFVGQDEARELWGATTAREIRVLLDRPRVLVVKDGAIGATAYHESGSEFVPSLKLTVREPVGAGDAFAAGWLAGFLRALPHGQRLRLGHLTASIALRSTADHQALATGPLLAAALSEDEAKWSSAEWVFEPDSPMTSAPPGDVAGV